MKITQMFSVFFFFALSLSFSLSCACSLAISSFCPLLLTRLGACPVSGRAWFSICKLNQQVSCMAFPLFFTLLFYCFSSLSAAFWVAYQRARHRHRRCRHCLFIIFIRFWLAAYNELLFLLLFLLLLLAFVSFVRPRSTLPGINFCHFEQPSVSEQCNVNWQLLWAAPVQLQSPLSPFPTLSSLDWPVVEAVPLLLVHCCVHLIKLHQIVWVVRFHSTNKKKETENEANDSSNNNNNSENNEQTIA